MVFEIKRYPKSAFIYLEGSNYGKEFYIVKSGRVMITSPNPILGEVEEIKSTGCIFGVIQCITGIKVSETVQAYTDCEVFIIKKNKIGEAFEQYPKVILKIISEYSEILRKLDRDLVKYDFFLSGSDRNEKVFDIAEKYIAIHELFKASHLLKSYIDEKNISENNIARAIKLLENLPDSEILEINEIISEKKVSSNAVIFTEAEMGAKFFIIKKGKVRITKLKNDNEILIAILGPGDIFGEMAVLNDKPRNATASSVDDTRLMIIDKKGISRLPKELFYKLLLFLTKRIWLVEQQLIAYKLPDIIAKLYYLLTAKVKQAIPNINDESKSSFLFKFPLNELFEMIDYQAVDQKEITPFLEDSNFEFYEDSIMIKSIDKLMAKNSYHFTKSLREYKSLLDDI